jgi:hypothetical protein
MKHSVERQTYIEAEGASYSPRNAFISFSSNKNITKLTCSLRLFTPINIDVICRFNDYADDVNLFGDSVNTIKENTEILFEFSTDVSLEINAEKTKYMIMSRHPNSGQNQNVRILMNRLKRWQNSNT